eukprot:TRINITY_DN4527_c0_g2_i1.p1 TRINITY_DN4527_c0_g2~~TRINITY_DN4527_c0_g2_i1.p1  ORF type:complete len:118 (-),score=23.37 TRINITY_DN4527_c0_g2_i1:383-736(-)
MPCFKANAVPLPVFAIFLSALVSVNIEVFLNYRLPLATETEDFRIPDAAFQNIEVSEESWNDANLVEVDEATSKLASSEDEGCSERCKSRVAAVTAAVLGFGFLQVGSLKQAVLLTM